MGSQASDCLQVYFIDYNYVHQNTVKKNLSKKEEIGRLPNAKMLSIISLVIKMCAEII